MFITNAMYDFLVAGSVSFILDVLFGGFVLADQIYVKNAKNSE